MSDATVPTPIDPRLFDVFGGQQSSLRTRDFDWLLFAMEREVNSDFSRCDEGFRDYSDSSGALPHFSDAGDSPRMMLDELPGLSDDTASSLPANFVPSNTKISGPRTKYFPEAESVVNSFDKKLGGISLSLADDIRVNSFIQSSQYQAYRSRKENTSDQIWPDDLEELFLQGS